MRATLHFSLLAATLSPSLVQSSPIPFTPNYNSSPRSSAQALSETSRPGGAFSSRGLLTHGGSRGYGYGLGILNLGSNNGGDGGDASSGNSYAEGGDHRDREGKHPADGGGPPTIDLGPTTPVGDQPEPEPSGNDASPKPGTFDPGDPAPPHHESKHDIDPNVGDSGNKSADANTPEKPVNPENPTTVPPKPGPDPEAAKTTPDVPVFLGPSNSSPPPGNSGPSSSAPQNSGYSGDKGRYEYTDDTPCDGLLDEPLINLLSNNGGDGGDASSGAATSIGDGGSGVNSAYSGAGGDASGGSVVASPALVNILSDNGGDGGYADSGDSFSKRHGSASYSGPGGKASGGSVKRPCSRRRAVTRVLTDSETSGNVLTEPRSGGSKLAVQRKWNGRSEAYSGKGGDASGGSVEGGLALINIGSGNGGHGGHASSGFAYANGSGAKAYSGPGGKATGGDVDRRALINVRTSEASSEHGNRKDSGAEAYTGPGGDASGGNVEGAGGLINLFSDNGGDGGDASSGDAFAYSKGGKAKASSGPGGDASGGSVKDKKHGYGHGYKSGGLVDVASGNGGDGGDASSGNAVAVSDG